MPNYTWARQIGSQLVELWNLPPNCVDIRIELPASGLAEVIVTYQMPQEQSMEFVEVVKQYQLVQIEEEKGG